MRFLLPGLGVARAGEERLIFPEAFDLGRGEGPFGEVEGADAGVEDVPGGVAAVVQVRDDVDVLRGHVALRDEDGRSPFPIRRQVDDDHGVAGVAAADEDVPDPQVGHGGRSQFAGKRCGPGIHEHAVEVLPEGGMARIRRRAPIPFDLIPLDPDAVAVGPSGVVGAESVREVEADRVAPAGRPEVFRPKADDRICALLQVLRPDLHVDDGIRTPLPGLGPPVIQPHDASRRLERQRPQISAESPGLHPGESRRHVNAPDRPLRRRGGGAGQEGQEGQEEVGEVFHDWEGCKYLAKTKTLWPLYKKVKSFIHFPAEFRIFRKKEIILLLPLPRMSDIEQLLEELRCFNKERDWDQFHNGKDLAIGLSVEASELLELFLWKDPKDVSQDKIREELADVLNYAFQMADRYGLDIKEIMLEKIRINAEKYPVDKAKGSAKKYNEL